MFKSGSNQWGSVAKFLHWTIVLLILIEGPLGLILGDLPKNPGAIAYFNFHKSIGITILALAVLRLVWRAFDPRPAAVPGMPRQQELAARFGHALLYVLIFLVPLSGWWFDSATALRPLYWFGLIQVPHLVAPNPAIKHLTHDIHEWLFWALAVTAAGHAAAALVHHYVNRDATLTRMLPGKHRRPLVAALVALAALAVVVPIGATLLQPPRAHDHDAAKTAAAAGADADQAATLAGTWQVDMAKSGLGFDGMYQGGAFAGKFGKFSAQIAYDETDLAHAKFDVTVQLASVDTGSGERDQTLATSDFFDTAKFPQAHFVTSGFARGADGGVVAQGTLTIRDQSKPVALKVKFAVSGGATTLDVSTTLNRLDFGLGAGDDWADIGRDVNVHGHLVLTAK